MADSFELLRSKIVIEIDSVKQAMKAVTDLQKQLKLVEKPVKINFQATGLGAAQNKKLEEQIKRIQRRSKSLQLGASDPNTSAIKQLDLLARAERALLAIRKQVNANSRIALSIEQQLAQIRKRRYRIQVDAGLVRNANEELKTMLKTLANVSAGIGQLPGVNRVIGGIFTATSRFGFAFAQLTKLSASMGSLTVGLAAVGIGAALAASAILKLASSAINAISAIGRAGLSAALGVLQRSLSLILTPVRLAYAELSRLFSIAGFKSFSNEALQLAGRMEQIQQQLKLRFGATATQEFERLRDEANLFGTDLLELSAGFARFALATEGAGISIQTTRDLFTGIQASARVFGTSVEDISGIFRAFEQIAGKGKLTSEELIRQLGDRLPGAFKLAADALGKTPAELVESLRTGSVSAKEFFDAFSRETITKFYQKAISLSDTLNARLARLRNIRNLIFIGAGDFISNTFVFAIERITQAAIRMRDAFRPISAVIGRISSAFRKSVASMNFETLFNQFATLTNAIAPVIEQFVERLGRIAIVFNGAVIVAAFAVIQVAITKINDLMGQFLSNLQKLTGIDLSSSERAFAAVAAAISVLPEIIAGATRVWDKFREVTNKFFSDAALNMQSLIKIWATAELIKNPAKAFGIVFALKKIDDIIESMKKPLEGDTGLSATIATELDLALKKIAEAQAKIQKIMEGEDPNGKNPAADALNQAAENVQNALKDPGEIISFEEFGRRLSAATFGIKKDETQVQQKQAADTAETAKNTREIADLMRRGDQKTPFFARSGW